MIRRLLPTVLGLGVGFVALTAFLVGLEAVFIAEDGRGADQERQNRRALESYASTSLRRLLRIEWDDAQERLRAVEADPLGDDARLWLISEGQQVLPRQASPQAQPTVRSQFAALVAGTAPPDDDGPRGERRQHFERLRTALGASDRATVEREVRFILQHRARWVLNPADDLPLVLAMLDVLATHSRPSTQLMRVVLRDGIAGEAPVEGLQRAVLRAWPRLSQDDVDFLCSEVVRQSKRATLREDDFADRCRPQVVRGAPVVPPGEGLWLSARTGHVVRVTSKELAAVAVGLGPLVAQVTTEMQLQGLLAATDRLEPELGEAPGLVSDVHVAVHADRFELAAAQRQEAFRLKTALAAVALVLGALIVVVALVAQRRRLQFVELKSDFVSTVSHELRTPLASLRLMAETLERRADPAARDYPRRIVAEVDHLAFLVENILSFNRIDKGRWAPRRATVHLADLRASLEEDAGRYSGARVETSFSGFELDVSADPELLRIVLLNLLRNACRYNARDPVTVRFEARREGTNVVMRITDNGVGIEEAHWERVFDAFHRLRAQQGRGGVGSGLGLALCRRVAALHEGSLRVEASSPAGTTFELSWQG